MAEPTDRVCQVCWNSNTFPALPSVCNLTSHFYQNSTCFYALNTTFYTNIFWVALSFKTHIYQWATPTLQACKRKLHNCLLTNLSLSTTKRPQASSLQFPLGSSYL